MQISLMIPDELAAGLASDSAELSKVALEALAVEGYRSARLSAFEVRQLLGHESRWETEEFLASHDAWPGTTAEELEAGLHNLESALTSPAKP